MKINLNKMIENTEKNVERDKENVEQLKTNFNNLLERLNGVNPNIEDDLNQIIVMIGKSGLFNVEYGIKGLCDVLEGMQKFQ